MLRINSIEKTHSKIVVFYITSPIGIINANSVANEYFNEGYFKVLVIIHKYEIEIDTSIWNRVLQFNLPIQVRILDKIKYFVFYPIESKNILKELKQTLNNFDCCEIVFQDFDIVVNNLFCTQTNIVKFSAIEDGIANYRKTYSQNSIFSKLYIFFAQKVLKITLFKFEGHYLNLDKDFVNNQYIRAPEFSYFKGKSLPLKYKPIQFLPNKNTILIIDTNEDFKSKIQGKHKRKLKILYSYLNENYKNYTVFHKPHRWSERKLEDIGNLSDYPNLTKIILVEKSLMVEDLLENMRPNTIFGFCSSALINIKLSLSPKNLELISLYNILSIPNTCPVVEVFEMLKIDSITI